MNVLLEKIRSSGPAAIVTSAFIGPGTIIVSTNVGISYGYSLLWAAVFAVIALMFLMEMASRIAIVSGEDLVAASIALFPGNRLWKGFIRVLMLVGVLTVCFAFQTGNLTGGSLGLADIFGVDNRYVLCRMILLWRLVTLQGSTRILEFIMKLFVGFMGFIFIVTMLFVKPDLKALGAGLIPQIPEGAYVLTLALVGTTLIGINLILHSITTKARWSRIADMHDARWDIGINIIIGGLITVALVVTAATILRGQVISGHPALAFTRSLEPVLGHYARIMGDLGLFAAGLSSAIAIPFTLKNIAHSTLHFSGGVNSPASNLLALVVIVFGACLSIAGRNPVEVIILAQAASGLFLPVVTALILCVANSRHMMGQYTNSFLQNLVGVLALVLTLLLGYNGITQAVKGALKLFGG